MNHRKSASAPERILQRLDWQVIRRLDGLLQGDYPGPCSTATAVDSPTCASTSRATTCAISTGTSRRAWIRR